MSIVNDSKKQKIWNNPGIGSPYNIWPSVAPTGSTRSAPMWQYGQSPLSGMWGYYNPNSIQSNWNTTYGSGNYNYNPYQTGRYAGQQSYPTNANYGYNRAGWYGRGRGYNRGMNNQMAQNILDRAVTDVNANYQWSQRDIDQIRRAAAQNPEYAKQLAQNYRNSGSFWDNTKSIDYGIPTYNDSWVYQRQKFWRNRTR